MEDKKLDAWYLYRTQASFRFGFHGTSEEVGNQVINGQTPLAMSENTYDWLGRGIYFWESDPQRALDWAQEQEKRGKLKNPAVIGAILDLGYCLDLGTQPAIGEVKKAYKYLARIYRDADEQLPQNRSGKDLLMRELDCQVINTLHRYRKNKSFRAYDSVRCAFLEAERVYPTSGFRRKTHVQIAILNKDCIKGYFLPISGGS